jgi:CheY-like chemotaxis protein
MPARESTAINERLNPKAKSTILVVEDEVIVRLMIAEELRAAGFVVLEAVNASEAITILELGNIGLVFTDLRMPGPMDGVDLAELVRTYHPDVRIITTSGHDVSRVQELSDAHFVKPYDVDAVIKCVARLLL